MEGIVALAAGFFGGSVVLVGFGLDSVIEVTSGGVLLWRLRSDTKVSQREKMEKTALKIVGLGRGLSHGDAGVSASEAPSCRPDWEFCPDCGCQTDFCTYLSAILLCGLLLDALLGWWWADPAAGLLMVPIIAKEGWGAVHGKTCCATCA